MFLLLMLVSLAVAILTTAAVIALFRGSISGILGRIVAEPVAAAWRRYVTFALVVVGISSGVSLWTLERYVRGGPMPETPPAPNAVAAVFPGPAPLTTEAWAFEIYRTVLGSLRGLAGALLLFFGIALVVSGVQRGLSERAGGRTDQPELGDRRARERSRQRGPLAIGNGRQAGDRRPLPGGGGTRPQSSGRRSGEGRPRQEPSRRDSRGDFRGGDRSGDGRRDRFGNGRLGGVGRGPGESGSSDLRPVDGDPARQNNLERR